MESSRQHDHWRRLTAAVRGDRLRGVDELRALTSHSCPCWSGTWAWHRPPCPRPSASWPPSALLAGLPLVPVLGRLGRSLQPQDDHRPLGSGGGTPVRAARVRLGRASAVPARAARRAGARQHRRDARGDHRPGAARAARLGHQRRGCCGPAGLAVGPSFGGPIVDQYGLQTLFLIDAAITGCIVVALIVGYHEAADRVRSLLPVLTLVRRSLIAVLRTPLRRGSSRRTSSCSWASGS